MRYNLAILTIGDELLIGQTINTNAAKIGAMAAKVGCRVVYSFCCPDEKDVMIDQLDYLLNRVDAVIITGGLGPTHDDITKEVLVSYFGDETELNESILSNIYEYFESRNRPMRKINFELAKFPRKAKIIPNSVGTAPGIHYDININGKRRQVYSVPGVPREMDAMATGYIRNNLEQLTQSGYKLLKYDTIFTSGIGESELSHLIGDIDKILAEGSSVAFLPSTQGVRIRIGVEEFDAESAKSKLEQYRDHISRNIVPYIVSNGAANKSDSIMSYLGDHSLTVSVAESCTGGMLGAYLTEKSGSSNYFVGGVISYSNQLKMSELGVTSASLKRHGAVSKVVVEEMAEGARKKYGSDLTLAITGVAGPEGGSDDKPAGTVWICLATNNGVFSHKHQFGKNRAMNRELSVSYASNILLKYLKEL